MAQFKESVQKYRRKRVGGRLHENNIEVWAIGGNIYYLKEWDEYIRHAIELHEFTLFTDVI